MTTTFHKSKSKGYRYIFFDLDGTITESAPGIVNAVCYALQKLGREVTDREQLLKFVGPPLVDSLQRFYGMSLKEASQGVVYYREYYAERGLYENSVYTGIPKMLHALRDAGKIVVIATSKPEAYAYRIAEHFDFLNLFEHIYGADMDGQRLEKEAVIRYALANMQLSEEDRGSVLMVGDRKFDVLGAKKNGLDCMGVLYGYGSREELEAAGALYIADTAADVAEKILSLDRKN